VQCSVRDTAYIDTVNILQNKAKVELLDKIRCVGFYFAVFHFVVSGQTLKVCPYGIFPSSEGLGVFPSWDLSLPTSLGDRILMGNAAKQQKHVSQND